MAFDPTNSFDDPSLKAAVSRLYGSETASPALRRRVAAAMADENAFVASHRRGPIFRIGPAMMYRAAAAAVLIFGIGFLGYVASNEFMSPAFAGSNRPVAHNGLNLAPPFTDALIHQHDVAVKSRTPLSIPGIPNNDQALVSQSLFGALGIPIAVSPPGDDWNVRGASIQVVANIPSAHLLFVHGKNAEQKVSIFSVPTACLGVDARDGVSYDEKIGDHYVAATIRGATVICVVASDPGALAESEVQQILKHSQNDVFGSWYFTAERYSDASR